MKCLFESVDCEHRNTGGCSRGDCVFAPQNNAESPSHSLQQLQAEIRALVEEFCDLYDGDLSNDAVSLLLTKLGELSAVQ